MREVETGEVTVDGVRSPLIQAGPADDSEAIVFLHGNPGSRLDWQDLVGRVGEFGRAVAFDMPGFGQADKPRNFDYTVEGYAGFIEGALEQLGVERVHLVVHDFGGPWGWAWASQHTDRLGSVVAINTGMLSGRKWHKLARIFRTPVRGELVMALTRRHQLEQALTGNGTVPLPGEFLDRIWHDFDRRTRRAILKLYRATDLPSPQGQKWVRTLAGLDPPTLILFGDRDPALPAEAHIRHLRSAFPSAEVMRLPESGHFPFADDPERSAQAVVPFLRSRLGARAPA